MERIIDNETSEPTFLGVDLSAATFGDVRLAGAKT
jgi:hypothetical protein